MTFKPLHLVIISLIINIQNLIAQELRRNGKNVIYFNYRGTWGSQGDFLYFNCIEEVGKLIGPLTTPENSNKFRIKPRGFALLGHSMGGSIALNVEANDNRVKKIVIYSPYLLDGTTEENLNKTKVYLESLFMFNTGFQKFIQDILSIKKN